MLPWCINASVCVCFSVSDFTSSMTSYFPCWIMHLSCFMHTFSLHHNHVCDKTHASPYIVYKPIHPNTLWTFPIISQIRLYLRLGKLYVKKKENYIEQECLWGVWEECWLNSKIETIICFVLFRVYTWENISEPCLLLFPSGFESS